MIAQIIKSAATTTDTLNEAAEKRAADQRASLAEVKVQLEALRAEIADGNKALRADVVGKLDKVLALLTPPPQPQLVKPLHALEPVEKEEKAA